MALAKPLATTPASTVEMTDVVVEIVNVLVVPSCAFTVIPVAVDDTSVPIKGAPGALGLGVALELGRELLAVGAAGVPVPLYSTATAASAATIITSPTTAQSDFLFMQ